MATHTSTSTLATTNKSAKKYIGKNEKLAIADSQAAQADELARGVQRTFQDIQKERNYTVLLPLFLVKGGDGFPKQTNYQILPKNMIQILSDSF